MEVRPLTNDETKAFREERLWLHNLLQQFGDEFKLDQSPADIPILQSLLDAEPFASGDEAALETLGGVFGDVVATHLGFDWVVVSDDYGVDFAIQHPKLPVRAFPRDMIIKRVESGELINLTSLFEGVIEAVRKAIDDAESS